METEAGRAKFESVQKESLNEKQTETKSAVCHRKRIRDERTPYPAYLRESAGRGNIKEKKEVYSYRIPGGSNQYKEKPI